MNKLSQREEAERLVETYSDLILRLCWTYLKTPRTPRTSARTPL